MRRLIVSVFVIVLTSSCATDSNADRQTIAKEDAEALMKIYREDMKDYRSFSLLPGTVEMMDGANGSGPHGRYVTTYTNTPATDAVKSDLDAMPDGALIVKDAFDTERQLRATVFMKKVEGAWYFGAIGMQEGSAPQPYKYGKAGSNTVNSCANCHVEAKKDMVFAWK